jgi:hypothetical protein
MQHCQHPHTASNFSNLTWAGQQSATLCLWCSRMETTNVLHHLLVLQNPHLTIFCTYNKTFHCEVVLHACQSLSSSSSRLRRNLWSLFRVAVTSAVTSAVTFQSFRSSFESVIHLPCRSLLLLARSSQSASKGMLEPLKPSFLMWIFVVGFLLPWVLQPTLTLLAEVGRTYRILSQHWKVMS